MALHWSARSGNVKRILLCHVITCLIVSDIDNRAHVRVFLSRASRHLSHYNRSSWPKTLISGQLCRSTTVQTTQLRPPQSIRLSVDTDLYIRNLINKLTHTTLRLLSCYQTGTSILVILMSLRLYTPNNGLL